MKISSEAGDATPQSASLARDPSGFLHPQYSEKQATTIIKSFLSLICCRGGLLELSTAENFLLGIFVSYGPRLELLDDQWLSRHWGCYDIMWGNTCFSGSQTYSRVPASKWAFHNPCSIHGACALYLHQRKAYLIYCKRNKPESQGVTRHYVILNCQHPFPEWSIRSQWFLAVCIRLCQGSYPYYLL